MRGKNLVNFNHNSFWQDSFDSNKPCLRPEFFDGAGDLKMNHKRKTIRDKRIENYDISEASSSILKRTDEYFYEKSFYDLVKFEFDYLYKKMTENRMIVNYSLGTGPDGKHGYFKGWDENGYKFG